MIDPNGLYRVWEVTSSRKKERRGILPFSRSTWLAGVRAGKFPKPIKIGAVVGTRAVAWRGSDLIKVLNELSNQAEK